MHDPRNIKSVIIKLLSLTAHQLKCVKEALVSKIPACYLRSFPFEEYKSCSVVTVGTLSKRSDMVLTALHF